MPQQTSASDFTKYKKIVADISSDESSFRPNVQLSNPLSPLLAGPVNLGTFLSTQANTIKHYTTSANKLTWHR
uniref:Uncharacterized protein n=1 Tax=viral metagenome TaxID=1070528 RepID=A0A6C0F055_9ZZZZ